MQFKLAVKFHVFNGMGAGLSTSTLN